MNAFGNWFPNKSTNLALKHVNSFGQETLSQAKSSHTIRKRKVQTSKFSPNKKFRAEVLSLKDSLT